MMLTVPATIKTTKKVPGCDACGKRIRTRCVFVAVRQQSKETIAVGKWKTAPRKVWYVKKNYHFCLSCIKIPKPLHKEVE